MPRRAKPSVPHPTAPISSPVAVTPGTTAPSFSWDKPPVIADCLVPYVQLDTIRLSGSLAGLSTCERLNLKDWADVLGLHRTPAAAASVASASRSAPGIPSAPASVAMCSLSSQGPPPGPFAPPNVSPTVPKPARVSVPTPEQDSPKPPSAPKSMRTPKQPQPSRAQKELCTREPLGVEAAANAIVVAPPSLDSEVDAFLDAL
jgi:hypothetical protein